MTNMNILRAWIAAALSTLYVGAHASAIQIERKPWPEAPPCEPCFNIQFGKLDMRFSPDEISKALVVGRGASTLHLFLSDNAVKDPSATFITQGDDRFAPYIAHGFFEKFGIKSVRDFFEVIGRPPGRDEQDLALMRKIEHIDTSTQYIETSMGSLHVFWIKASKGDTQNVYFVLDDGEVYQLSGDVTPELYRAILGRLRIKAVP